MPKIYSISAGCLRICINYLGKKNFSLEDVFKSLSFEMGGDGKTITKKQLSSYIDRAEKGLVAVDRNRLHALKKIQQNWDKISKGKDSVSLDDFKGFEPLLLATIVGSFNVTEIGNEDTKSLRNEIYDYLKISLDKSDINKEDLIKYLKDILAEPETSENNEDSNSDVVDTLINMISSYEHNSTIEHEV